MPKKLQYVCYFRVSTQKQGESGLGLDAQRSAVSHYVASQGGVVLEEFMETESGKQARNRPELQAALELCRRSRATLLIAKLDRLARNVHFISGLLESGVSFIAVDSPLKDRFMLHVQAAFAEEEARRISLRTREALAAAKRRGVVIGATGRVLAQRNRQEAQRKALRFRPHFVAAAQLGFRTTAQFRDFLNEHAVPGPGGGRWHLPNTHKTLRRLGGLDSLSMGADLPVDEVAVAA
jgi:DNA invertase Pin-like site-specific DNA recombinase